MSKFSYKGHVPRKRFGQNFLNNQTVINQLIDAIKPLPEQNFFEIGPGKGAITYPLVNSGAQLEAVEIDRDLFSYLQNQLKNFSNFKIHCADALEFDLNVVHRENNLLRIVGNLPYNIATPLIFHLLDYLPTIDDMHFMLQKEVVERITARPGSKAYGRLSVMVQYHCEAVNLFEIPKEAFFPIPKVTSAIVCLKPKKNLPDDKHIKDALIVITREAFNHRRKTILNSLKGFITAENLSDAGISGNRRPETLSLQEFITLAHLYNQSQSNTV